MKALSILLSGSSGLVGSALRSHLLSQGHRVVCLVRDRSRVGNDAIFWDPMAPEQSMHALEGFDAVIHLAGENIAQGRWTEAKKERLKKSRVRDSRALAEALNKLERPPQVVLSASAIGFYGDRGDEVLTERSAAGKGFLAELCVQWEASFHILEQRGVRVVHLRFGPILSSKGGMLKKLLIPFKLGLGGRIGTGAQQLSWIGIADAIGSICHCLRNTSLVGPVNVTSPHPVSQAEFARTLAQHFHRPAWLPLPAFIVRLLFGEMGDALLLCSAKVIPEKLLNSGYQFQAAQLKEAFKQL